MARAIIYLDHAATTPVAPEVVAAMTEVLAAPELAANPAAAHGPGRRAAAAVESARAAVAALVGAEPGEIVFTSGATESVNLAITGVARFLASRGRHLVTSLTEHPAGVETCRRLVEQGWRVTWLRPDAAGHITPAAVAAALQPDTVLVSLMHANNETGTLTDLRPIGALCRERGVLLHVDAAQSAGHVPLDVRALGADLASLSAHKLGGPPGVGALFLDRDRVRRIEPLLAGGGQERGLRPGTVAIHQVVGMGEACRLAAARLAAHRQHVTALRDRLWARLGALPGVHLNSDLARGTGHVLNVSVEGAEGESLHEALAGGLAVARGAACTSQGGEPSRVLRVLGRSPALAAGSVRFSFGWTTTVEDIDRAADLFGAAVAGLRARAPGWSAPDPGLPAPGDRLATGEAGSEEAGTRVVFTARVRAGLVAGLDARVYGCPHTRAACDEALRRLRGAPVADLGSLAPGDLGAAADMPPAKAGRLLVIQDALRNCLADWDNGRLTSAP